MSAWADTEPDEYREGFLTSFFNRGIEKGMAGKEKGDGKLTFGRHVTDFVSAPQFGGYVIGSYSYSSQDHDGRNGFDGRMIRMYVSGTLLRHFRYRVQMELKGTPSMRDYTLEWVYLKEFQVKVGQFKRCFSYDNPLNPWDVGMGSYSQLAGRMTALAAADCSGEPAQNGRDVGVQLQGDLFPVGRDGHRLVRYQAAVYNGNGQNRKDNNKQKDWIGNIQLQPIEGFYVGLFGWTGTYTGDNGITVRRRRWALSTTCERAGWSFRAEYAHHNGPHADSHTPPHSGYDAPAQADAWYVLLGAPVTSWLKIYGRYDVFRHDATWSGTRSIYSLCPNIQLHHNLLFQLQYNYVHDRTAAHRDYHELWTQAYVRF